VKKDEPSRECPGEVQSDEEETRKKDLRRGAKKKKGFQIRLTAHKRGTGGANSAVEKCILDRDERKKRMGATGRRLRES